MNMNNINHSMAFSQRQSDWLHRCSLSSVDTEDTYLTMESEKEAATNAATDDDTVFLDSIQDHTTNVAETERRVGCPVAANRKQVTTSTASKRRIKHRFPVINIKAKSLFQSISSSEVEDEASTADIVTRPRHIYARGIEDNSFSLLPRRPIFQYFGADASRPPLPVGRTLYHNANVIDRDRDLHPNPNPINNTLLTDQSSTNEEDLIDPLSSFNSQYHIASMQHSTRNVPSTPPPTIEDYSIGSPPVLNKKSYAFFDFDNKPTPPALFLCEDNLHTTRY